MSRRSTTTRVSLGAALLAAVALSVAVPANASTPRARSLARQVRTLKSANAKLRRERNTARAKLATCQQGVGPAVSTMTPYQLTSSVFPAANLVFEHWQDGTAPGQFTTFDLSSHTVSQGYYEDWTYTFDLTEWQ
jgi:outer membrane murein-binding lipoprotein Lpp